MRSFRWSTASGAVYALALDLGGTSGGGGDSVFVLVSRGGSFGDVPGSDDPKAGLRGTWNERAEVLLLRLNPSSSQSLGTGGDVVTSGSKSGRIGEKSPATPTCSGWNEGGRRAAGPAYSKASAENWCE